MTSEVLGTHRRRVLRLLCFLTMISMLVPGRAHAYIDPSTGSLLIQVLIAGALGAAFTAKQWWGRAAAAARQLRERPPHGNAASGSRLGRPPQSLLQCEGHPDTDDGKPDDDQCRCQ
jgi:hypothetical protein